MEAKYTVKLQELSYYVIVPFTLLRSDTFFSLSKNLDSETATSENNDDNEKHQQTSGKTENRRIYRFDLVLHGKPFPVREDEGPFTNFFLDKISKNIKEKYPESNYQLEKNENSEVTAVVWQNINENLRREIEDALEWSLRKIDENRKAGI